MAYDPRTYWGRLHDRRDLSAVGQSGLPVELNRWLYLALERRIRRLVRRHRLLDGVAAAFDVGAGTGYWVDLWYRLGVPRVDGCDLVPAAAAALEARFGARGSRFVAVDVGAPGGPLGEATGGERYGLVSVMNVLLHIVEDEPFERALAAVAGLVAPGGHLLLVEPMLFDATYERPRKPEQASRARPLAAYRDPVLAAGLELVEVSGAVALANNPIEAGSPAAYRRFVASWRWIARRARTSPGSFRVLGPALVATDRIALAAGAAPTSKVALFRRPPAP